MWSAPTSMRRARRRPPHEVNGKGGQALALKVDVTKRSEVNDMVARAVAAFGGVQFLFNSAGAAIRRAKFLEIDDALMDKTFALNVNGTLYAMQAVLPHMLANKSGVIVNMASMAHRRGGPGSSIHYAAAKGAVVSMTLGVAREFATQGIRALSISPGPIKTPFQDAAQSSPELIKRFLDDIPMQRFGEPEEIGELVLFLCSDACGVHDRRHRLRERRRRLAIIWAAGSVFALRASAVGQPRVAHVHGFQIADPARNLLLRRRKLEGFLHDIETVVALHRFEPGDLDLAARRILRAAQQPHQSRIAVLDRVSDRYAPCPRPDSFSAIAPPDCS